LKDCWVIVPALDVFATVLHRLGDLVDTVLEAVGIFSPVSCSVVFSPIAPPDIFLMASV
jgi:hypothetical protein